MHVYYYINFDICTIIVFNNYKEFKINKNIIIIYSNNIIVKNITYSCEILASHFSPGAPKGRIVIIQAPLIISAAPAYIALIAQIIPTIPAAFNVFL